MPGSRRTAATKLLAVLTVGVVAIGCGSTVSPAPATPTARAGPSLTPVPNPGATDAPVPGSPATQTDTDWGRIWDTLPAGFPRIPGSLVVDDGAGPASAELSVPAGPAEALKVTRQLLEAAGYATTSVQDGLENGGSILESARPGSDCRVETAIAPFGGTTRLTILYGAGCPFD